MTKKIKEKNNDRFEILKNTYSSGYIADEIHKFEPLYFPRDIDKVSEEHLNELLKYVNPFKERLLINKYYHYVLSNRTSMSLIYSYMLRTFSSLKDYVYVGKNKKVKIKDDIDKSLLILLVADKELKYLNSFLNLKDSNYSSMQIKEELIKIYGFYSYKLLDLELQYTKLLQNIKEKQLTKTR